MSGLVTLALCASASVAAAQSVREGHELPSGWTSASHQLGRGRLRADEVSVTGRGFRLGLAPGACDGAEVRTVARHHFGTYAMRMRMPHAPGSLSAFFLYADVRGGNDEIDIEVHNDSTGTALLTTWIAGEKTHELIVPLGFDPTSAFHEYAINWSRESLRFEVDGAPLAVMHDRFPTAPMKVMANVWWPVWTHCVPPLTPLALEIEAVHLGDR